MYRNHDYITFHFTTFHITSYYITTDIKYMINTRNRRTFELI